MIRRKLVVFLAGLLLVMLIGNHAAKAGETTPANAKKYAEQRWAILVDDFKPQPKRGEAWWQQGNRLGGNRGQIDGPPSGKGRVVWEKGFARAAIDSGVSTYVGVFSSLNHPDYDCKPLNFSAIFPPQILSQYQGRITALRIQIRNGKGRFKIELRAQPVCSTQQITKWDTTVTLQGGQQTVECALPDTLRQILVLNWIVIGDAGDFVEAERVELIANLPALELPQRAFLWSYSMLLANWNPASGLTRDHAYFAAGFFDNVSAGAMLSAATVMASHLGFIAEASTKEIVAKTTDALMALDTCKGLWPHFLTNGRIKPGTEWSSIDTIIALIALIEARQALALPTAALENALAAIAWNSLLVENKSISHGYYENCTQHIGEAGKPKAIWKDFGTESWLVNLGYAAATSDTAVFDHTPPTYNGSGFIDELAWLLVPAPQQDRWGTEWCAYRQQATEAQIAYYRERPCFGGPPRLFGLSAAEVPDLSLVIPDSTYQAFGDGGDTLPNDGVKLFGHAVIVPHYAGLISSLRPAEALALWEWLEQQGLFTPLNNVESLMFNDESTCSDLTWNALKGSWNLSLQTLGWGRYLAGENNPLCRAMWNNAKLRRGWETLVCDATPCAPALCTKTAVAETKEAVPVQFQLLQSYPNPFSPLGRGIFDNPSTAISFSLPAESEVSLTIYNMNGQAVKHAATGIYASGRHEVVWNAQDDHGLRVASGVYFYVLEARRMHSASPSFVAKRKLVVMK